MIIDDLKACGRNLGLRGRFADGLAVRQPFKRDVDFGLSDGTPEHFVPLCGARFLIVFPGELHPPLIGDGMITTI